MGHSVGLRHWLVRLCVAVPALAALGIALAVLNNNVSISAPSRADFVKRLDRSLAASSAWTTKQFSPNSSGELLATDLGMKFVSNPQLVHMLVDLSAISGDPQLAELSSKIVAEYRRSYVGLMGKIVDPSISGPPRASPGVEEYKRWMLYAISPEALPLSDAERADLFSPDKFRMYNLTHQLFALYLYRRFHGETPGLSAVMDRVERHVATEAALDFRVTDLYLQRIAFLLAAGRPDLIKPRWVERALAAQQNDGGWCYTWYGWGPHLFSYTPFDQGSLAHSTAQGMWLTNMLKHRYPEWIEKNYK